jgi:high-affinity iron transporter
MPKIIPKTIPNIMIALLCFITLMFVANSAPLQSAETKYNSWKEIAEAMCVPLEKAYELYAKGGSWEEARDLVNEAYFGFYEKEGFERYVKQMISGKRASTVEFKFATIKTNLKKGESPEKIKEDIDILIGWLLEDGAILDVKFGISASPTSSEEGASAAAAGSEPGSEPSHGAMDFVSALLILLREGFEAILVIAAIAAYLKRSGNESHIKTVYISSALAVAASFLAAIAFQKFFASQTEGGQNQEILEGATMLLATVVLFGVSNWMFSKAEAQAWKSYIEGKVKSAVTRGSAFALAATAFLAVFREGAETILFYMGLFMTKGANPTMIWSGFLVGCVGLAFIFLIIRHGSVRLPLKPFFIGTSILMFIMAFAFLGGGIKELQEGDAIGVTPITTFPIPTIDILGVYPIRETLFPQIGLLLLALISGAYIYMKANRIKAGEINPA